MKKKSFALILSLILVAALTILGVAIISRSISENSIAQNNLGATRAFWLAEAGLQRALWSLNHNDWTGWSGDSVNKNILIALATGGEYYVEVSGIGGNSVTITSYGDVPQRSDANVVERAINCLAQRHSEFSYATFGRNSVTLSGNAYTDSYDSANGSYGAGNRGSNGDVGTNGTTAGAISASGNARINGDAGTGIGGTVVLNGNASVTGTITSNTNVNLAQVSVPGSLSGLSSSGAINVSGNNSQTISGGNYKYSSISVSGNGRLTISGNADIYITSTNNALNISGNGRLIITASVKVYVDGRCVISGNGVVNNTQLPQNFLLYGASTSDNIQISGNGNFYGAIYAPDADVSVTGNGATYGSIVGRTAMFSGNGGMHYDEALARMNSGGNYNVTSWKEQHNPYELIP
jgi:hypothetical protein